eukprot:jgi/Mesvir1/25701/Mv25971-RA.1
MQSAVYSKRYFVIGVPPDVRTHPNSSGSRASVSRRPLPTCSHVVSRISLWWGPGVTCTPVTVTTGPLECGDIDMLECTKAYDGCNQFAEKSLTVGCLLEQLYGNARRRDRNDAALMYGRIVIQVIAHPFPDL